MGMALLAAGAPNVAAAQSDAKDSAQPEDTNKPTAIVVTAQRREENLAEVPLSVSVVGADALAARNMTNPAQLPLVVPSLQLTNFQASPGATNFSVRGIGTASFSHLIEPSVATVIDGVVMGRPEMGVMEFSDLERIEVLNGPQGMLFGKNASAGLVNIVTTRPQLGATNVRGEVSWGNVEAASDVSSWRINSTVNVPLGQDIAARVTGYVTDDGALIGNTYDQGFKDFGRTQFGGRAKFLWEGDTGLSVYLSGDYAKSEGMGTGVYTARADAPGGGFEALDQQYGIVASPDNLFQSGDAPTDLIFKVGGVQGEFAFEFANGISVTNIAAWRAYDSEHTIDFDLRPVDITNVSSAAFSLRQFTNEVRIASPSSTTFEYQAGLYYYHATGKRTDLLLGQLDLGAPPPGFDYWLGLRAQNDLTTDSYAGYAQATWHATDALALTVGGRLTRDELDFFGTHNNDDIVIGIQGDPGTQTYVKSQGNTNFSWRLSALYEFTPDINGYVTVARGYKGPGYNLSWSGVPGAASVGPETSMNYEGGIKAVFGPVRLDLSAYWEKFTDFQVQSYRDTDTPGVGTFLIQNAGSLRARGVEGNASWNATPDLTLSGSFAYNDAVYTSFLGAPCYPGQSAAQGCINGVYDASGNRLVNAPEWSGNVALDYETFVGTGYRIVGHGDVAARSKVNFSPNGNPNTIQDGYAVLNASLGFGDEDATWTVTAFCRNCANQRYVTFIESNPGGAIGDYGQSFALDSFRTIGLKFGFDF